MFNSCSSSWTSPCSIKWYLQLGKSTACHRGEQHSSVYIQCVFNLYLQKKKGCFLKSLHKNRPLLVSLQVLFDCWIVFWTNESEKRVLYFFVQAYREKKYHLTRTKEKIVTCEWPRKESSRGHDQKNVYKSDNMQHQRQFLTIQLTFKSFLSATTVLSQRPNVLTYNTTASLDKLTCSNYVDFGEYRDNFGPVFWSQNDSNYLQKIKTFKEDDRRDLRPVQNLTMGAPDFNQLVRLRSRFIFIWQISNLGDNYGSVLLLRKKHFISWIEDNWWDSRV